MQVLHDFIALICRIGTSKAKVVKPMFHRGCKPKAESQLGTSKTYQWKPIWKLYCCSERYFIYRLVTTVNQNNSANIPSGLSKNFE